ncbi:MAG TPA: topoisomerase DNA-binding C4 zinc finger domain-containing protein, partial [Candidatus Obscuribacter sp.]|nr:topoisomerase DNA-binding C4 zinc finger domain-containing protein [Candidatus Obscuribacter sp.]
PRAGCGGFIVEKKSRHGKVFWGCSNYGANECTSAFWYPPLTGGGPGGSNFCPKCNSMLIYKTLKRGDQIACSSKTCDFAQLITGQETHA